MLTLVVNISINYRKIDVEELKNLNYLLQRCPGAMRLILTFNVQSY